jgi:methyl-accepting chemotaxis protein
MTDSNLQTLLIVFIGLTSLAVLMQAFVLLGLFLAVRKAVNFAKEEAEEYRGKLAPIISSLAPMVENGNKFIASGKEFVDSGKELVFTARNLVSGLEPQLKAAATEMSEMTRSLHAQTERLQAQADEIAGKVRSQSERVDGMTTSFLNGVDRAGRFLNEAVSVPIRRVNGVVAAAKAVVDTLRTPAPPRAQRVAAEVPADEKDLFI